MTTADNYLATPMAFYASGIALADWLTGNSPKAIYALKRFPQTSGQSIANRSKRLWVVGTKLTPVKLTGENAKRSEIRNARPIALNQSCVVLGGIAAMQHLGKIHKEAVRPAFHLTISDIDRAAKLLEPVTSSAEMAGFHAFKILEGLVQLYEEPELKQLLEEMAEVVLTTGELSEANGGWLGEFLLGHEEFRVEYPKSLIEWPSMRGNYIQVSAQDKEKSLGPV